MSCLLNLEISVVTLNESVWSTIKWFRFKMMLVTLQFKGKSYTRIVIILWAVSAPFKFCTH